VSVQEVDVFKVQTRQRRIRALNQVLPAQSTVVHRVVTIRRTPVDLCRHDQVVALPAELLDSLSHADFTLAAGVALGAVEEIDCADASEMSGRGGEGGKMVGDDR